MNVVDTSDYADFDVLAHATQRGECTIEYLVMAFLARTVFMPSSTNPTQALTPVMVDVRDQRFIVVATCAEAMASLRGLAKFAVNLTGAQVVSGARADMGVMVTLSEGSFALAPELIAQVRKSFNLPVRPD
ncbi:MAG: hypothetical protein FWD63_05590 [Propionibacteriaceae bacterium]|nr:hypothetical protein [Propionibacteriaceae bacterium]